MLSKNLKHYLLIMLLTLITALLTGGEVFYMFLIFETVLLLSMYIIQRKNAKNIFPFLDLMHKEIYYNDQIKINFDCHNSGPLPIAEGILTFSIENDYYNIPFEPVIASIKGYGRVVVEKNLVNGRRGLYNTGKIRIDYVDPLHLFPKFRAHEQEIELLVYPRIQKLNYFYLPNAEYYGSHLVKNSNFEDYSSIKKIRKYQYGDTLKRVHWKITSKFNELHVKEYALTANPKITLLMNSNHLDYDYKHLEKVDLAVEVTVSIVEFTLKKEIETNIVYDFSNEKLVGKDYSAFKLMLKSLTTFRGNLDIDFYDLVLKESQKLSKNAFLCLVTPSLSHALFKTLISLRKSGTEISLVFLHGEEKYANDQISLLKAHNVRCYFVNNSDTLVSILEGIRS